MQKFEFLRQSLLGELAMSPEERKKEREKMPFIVATYVYASSQGQRMHSAQTNNGDSILNEILMVRLQPVTICMRYKLIYILL